MSKASEAETSSFRYTTNRKRQYLTTSILLFVGIAASIVIYLVSHDREWDQMVRDFERASYDRVVAAKKTLDFDLLVLQAVQVFYDSSQEVDRHEFQVFVKPFVQDRLSIHAIEWVPRVRHSERLAFENKAVEEGFADFQIKEPVQRKKWGHASNRDEYFPISFAETSTGNLTVLGYDLSTVPGCVEAMNAARDTGRCTLTGKITSVHENDCTDVVAFLPVYHKNVPLDTIENRRQALEGYVAGTLSPKWITQEGLAGLMPEGIDVVLLDTTIPNKPELLYHDPSRLKYPDADKTHVMISKRSPLHSVESFDVAGRQWSIVCFATPLFMDLHTMWYPSVSAVGVLLLTGLLGFYLFEITGRNARITRLADQLTHTNSELEKEIANREQIKAHLKTSQTKYKTLYEASGDAITYADPQKGILGGNPAAIALFGCKDEKEFTSCRLIDFFVKYQPDGSLSAKKVLRMRKVALQGGTIYFELQLKRLDGSEFLGAVQLTGLELNGNSLVMATIRDITEQRQKEIALQENETRYRQLFAQIADAIFVADAESKMLVDCNKKAEQMTGYSREKILSMRADQLHPEEVREETMNGFLEQATGIPGKYVETMVLTKTGETIPVLISAGPVTIGEKLYLIGVFKDISEQKQAEEERVMSLQRMESLLALSRMTTSSAEEISAATVEYAIRLTGSKIGYLARVDEEETKLTMQYWSKSVYASCRIPDKSFVFPLEKLALLGEPLRQRRPVITNDYANSTQNKHDAPEGHVPIERHMSVPVFEGEKIVAVAGVGNKSSDYDERDVTQIQLLIEGWRQILSQKQFESVLAQARDDAEAANRAKSQFLATMSHEIRTPMTAILGYAELLMDPSLNAKDRDNYAITIRRSGEHLLSLINDILDLSKIEAGKMALDIGSCNIVALLADVASIMRPRTEANHLDFVIKYLGKIPKTIQTDGSRLRQTIINLVGNAVKFTEEGGVRIQVAFLKKEPSCGDQPAIRFQVIDTGIGIQKEILSTLFKPFSQGDASITQRFGGTGLGLAISYHIAQLLGGNLTVNSEYGTGSTFTLTVPTGNLEGVPMLKRPAEVAGEVTDYRWQPMKKDLHDVRVLLAEDGEDNRRLIKTVLTKAGASIETVENGKLAVQRAEEETFDLILMDMNMPEMDGYTATKLLRDHGYSRPILALTANAMTEDRQRCHQAGCDDYLTKPIDRTLLIETIAKYVKPARVE